MKELPRRIAVLLLSGVLLLSAGCGMSKKKQPEILSLDSEVSASTRPHSLAPFRCETIYVPVSERGQLPEIAVVNDRLYYLWSQASGADDDRTIDEHLDVMNMAADSEWKRVSNEDEKEQFITKLRTENTNYSPLYEKVGRFAVYTDEHNDFYLVDTENERRTNLQLNLENWRRFSTDHETYFAVLSAFVITVEGEFVNEIRYYELNEN